MHLRNITVGASHYHLVTLRPSTSAAFSTNFFHHTWHIVTDQPGARLLGRLLWGLAYQRQPGTVILVHGDHLLPTPFEGERSDPFLLGAVGLTRFQASDLRILKSRLTQLGPPAKTIRWHTFGLDVALQARQQDHENRSAIVSEGECLWQKSSDPLWRQERMERLGGFICYSAPPAILRQQALTVCGLQVREGRDPREMDYHFLAHQCPRGRSSYADGEVQIFADYRDRVAAACEARRELLANPRQPVLSETVQEAISRRRDQFKVKRRADRHLFVDRQTKSC